MRTLIGLLLAGLAALPFPIRAQPPAPPPPAVGVERTEARPVRETNAFVGRVAAPERVEIVARVSAFVEARLFEEGSEVTAGQKLFRLERATFAAAVAQQEAAVAQAEARAEQAEQALARAQSLAGTPAGLRAALDDARANQAVTAAALQGARAQLEAARINLAYTEITAPIAGRIGRANVSVGAAVGPGTGALVSIVSQDPMQVYFPIALRAYTELEARYRDKGGLAAVRVRIRLPDGSEYDQAGRIDFTAPSVNAGTDTIQLRARFPNPARRLIDGAFVAVTVEGIEPVMAITLPRQAILADVRGFYVWVVGEGNRVARRAVRLGPSTPDTAVIDEGLAAGEMVIVDGMQRARPGIVVAPGPAAPTAPGGGAGGPAAGAGRR